MDGGLVALQAAELFDSIRIVLCALAFVVGVGVWVHATYFMKTDD